MSGVRVRRRETPHHHKNSKVISITGGANSTEKLMEALSLTQESSVSNHQRMEPAASFSEVAGTT